jgi:hypothetical protein
MQLSKDEALRMAVALDTAITCMEFSSNNFLPTAVTPSLAENCLIHLRELRSAALRVNRRDPEPEEIAPYDPFQVHG